MTINSLKELNSLIKLCRKTGVQSIKVDGIEFHLSSIVDTPSPRKSIAFDIPEAELKVPQFSGIGDKSIQDRIDTSELTDEQMLYYSARPESPGEQ